MLNKRLTKIKIKNKISKEYDSKIIFEFIYHSNCIFYL